MADSNNTPVEKRLHYFDGQYLKVEDFADEQNYHLDRQRRPLQFLAVSGILNGLTVKLDRDFTIELSPGSAIDAQGRQILLQNSALIRGQDVANQAGKFTLDLKDLKPTTGSIDVWLILSYDEIETDRQEGEGSAEPRRWHERPKIEVKNSLAPQEIALAKLTISTSKLDVGTRDRRYSGMRFPTEDGSELTARSQGSNQLAIQGNLTITGITADAIALNVTNANAQSLLTVRNDGNTGIGGNLSITGNTGIGTNNPGARLEVKGATNTADTIALSVTNANAQSLLTVRNNGNTGIGTAQPSSKLAISGGVAIGSTYASKTPAPDIANGLILEGNLGIGTIKPNRRLELVDDIKGLSFEAGSGTPNAGAIRFGDNSGWKLHFGRSRESVSNTATLNTSDTGVLMTIQDNGTVGITNSDPTAKLDILHSAEDKNKDGTKVSTVLRAVGAVGSIANIDLAGHIQLKEYGTNQRVYLQARDDTSNRNIGMIIRTQTQQPDPAKTPQLVDALTILPSGDVEIQKKLKTPKLEFTDSSVQTTAAIMQAGYERFTQNTGTISKPVDFPKPFVTAPIVFVAIARLDFDKKANLRIAVTAVDITKEGFKIKVEVWGDTYMTQADINWLAFAN